MSVPAEEFSLQLGFDVSRTKAELRVPEQYRSDLVQLTARFRTGRQLGPTSALVDLEDLLSGINVLASWPAPEEVQWDSDLSALVVSSLQDAETAEKQLSSADTDTGLLTREELDIRLGSDWSAPLTEFQRRDISKLLALRHGANFSVPGAGKTRAALGLYAVVRTEGAAKRLLVISPKSAYESWIYETGTCFSPGLRYCKLDSGEDPHAEVLIANYERLDRNLAYLAAWLREEPSVLILDEAHRMKLGAKGTYGAACMALGPLAKRRLILTGTPAPNGAKDLENLLGFVWPGHGQRVVTQAVAGGDLAHASAVLRPLFTRTTKQELGLPPVTAHIERVDLPPLHDEIYRALVGDLSARAEASSDDFAALGKSALRMLMAATNPALLLEGSTKHEPVEYRLPPLDVPENGSLYQLLQDLPDYELPPKYRAAVGLVAENVARGRKTLIWTTFVRSLTSLAKLLEGEGYPAAVVYGGTPNREEEIRRFREDPDCMVLVSNPATLGEGISLHQVCHDAVYVDRDFMAGRYLQSLDRIHRLGLADDVETRITVLAARDTIDEVVETRLRDKLEFMSKVLDDPEVQQLADLQDAPAGVGGLDIADVRAVLKHIGKA
ncbi:DEAD/DEAH box helicase [Streptomyces smyrnaeus]|uniref:DEAD/DEAH box helicase n=1 Tax=Streptomyces smyrnaeus TaxID=1387713 RepID=A0ABS3Y3I7_9ACTN|nr:DEAD/DEAH box helicase [Streptomyces smyrnaeus]MBO8202171.1 DEAD/DEAH box helicase [Streptomyces smyrnaeus]